MIKLETTAYSLPLKHVFTIARGSTTVRETLIVSLSIGNITGYGEATANRYYQATIPELISTIEVVKPLIEGFEFDEPDELIDVLLPKVAEEIGSNSFALCAIDLALHDLWGKLLEKPLWQLWDLDKALSPISSYTIGIDTVEKMVAKLKEVSDWPLIKIKLGTEDDLRIVRELRKASDATFRVDANCGWTVDQTISYSAELRSLGVEFIEQPLPADDLEGAAKVFEESSLPIIADESCVIESDVDRCHNRFHGINIKLVKCGGLAPARRMIDRAGDLGMKLMVGCMTESTVGISAIGQIAPLLDYVDMDGAALLAEDIANGVKIEQGKQVYPSTPGSGITLLQEESEHLRLSSPAAEKLRSS